MVDSIYMIVHSLSKTTGVLPSIVCHLYGRILSFTLTYGYIHTNTETYVRTRKKTQLRYTLVPPLVSK